MPGSAAGHFRSFGTGTEDWTWELNLEARFTFVSENVERILGYSPLEMVGSAMIDFMPTEEMSRIAAIFEDIKTSATPIAAVEHTALHRAGRRVILETCAMPIFRVQGGLRAFRGISRDITQLTRSALALRESERQLREAQRIARLGHYTLWVARGEWQSSEELDRIFGIGSVYSRDVNGWLRIVHPGDREFILQHLMEHVLRDGNPFDRQYRIVRQSDGEVRWVNGLGRLVSDPESGLLQMVGTIQDITERKMTENALAESESRYRFVSESMNEGVWDWNLSTNKIYLSGSCSKILNYKPGVIGDDISRWPALLADEERAGVLSKVLSCVEGRTETFTVECQLRTGSGSWLWVMVVGKSVERGPEGRANRIVGTLADISGRRLLEDQLRQAQKLEAVGQLAGGVAHDFNNILASMSLQLDLMDLEIRENGLLRDGLCEIRKATQRAAGLTRQLLTFSRRTVPQMQRMDLNTVVNEMLKMLLRLIGENVDLRFEASPDLPSVHADAGMVEQVLMNLVVNARDAMPQGGRLTIHTDSITLEPSPGAAGGRPAGRYVRLSVEDTGCGMGEEVRNHLFEPFFTTKAVGHGTGLGLATIHGIVVQHHGWIDVRSTVGSGSQFVVHWPVSEAGCVDERAEAAAEEFPRGVETILLVEDEQGIRRNISLCLKELGYTVLEAANGNEALKKYPEGRIDLLFSDMMMPGGISGVELAMILRQKQPDLKVVISSGYVSSNSEVFEKSRNLQFLQKPYDLQVLAVAVRQCLDA